MGQRLGHRAERAIATGGHDHVHAMMDGLGNVAFSVTVFPGHPHLQLHALPAPMAHGVAQLFVACGFAIEDQAPARVVMRYFQVRAAQASNALFARSECHAGVIQLLENGRP